MKQTNSIDEVVIVGAGLSGLTAAYELRRLGIDVRVLEKEETIGASWRQRHPQLSLNTHRDVSHLPGIKYPAGTPAFPKRDSVVAHLQQFVRDQGLKVERGVTVHSVSQPDRVFHLSTSSGPIISRNLVIATGRDGDPFIPAFRGHEHFSGHAIHAKDFGSAQQYKGKRVLIVGGGNSGFDIANHLSKIDLAECWLSVRTGSSVLPKRLYGIAVHKFSPLLARLPNRVADAAIALVTWAAFGNLEILGFPRSDRGAATRLAQEHIAIPVDDGALRAVREGRIKVVGEVAEFTSVGTVHHKDGTATTPDVVIYATGYTSSHTRLLESPKGEAGQSMSADFDLPGLWFIGSRPSLVSYFHQARHEAAAVAEDILKRKKLDSETR